MSSVLKLGTPVNEREHRCRFVGILRRTPRQLDAHTSKWTDSGKRA
jgi:hypothetical protein